MEEEDPVSEINLKNIREPVNFCENIFHMFFINLRDNFIKN